MARPYKKRTPESVRPPQRKLPGRGRTPLNGRNVLSIPGYDPEGDSEHVLRIVNDDPENPGRVERFKEAGWEPVIGESLIGDPSVENVRQPGSAVTRPVGGGVLGVVMRKKRSEEAEDWQPIEQRNQLIEETIFGELDQEERYGRVTAFGRTVERTSRRV